MVDPSVTARRSWRSPTGRLGLVPQLTEKLTPHSDLSTRRSGSARGHGLCPATLLSRPPVAQYSPGPTCFRPERKELLSLKSHLKKFCASCCNYGRKPRLSNHIQLRSSQRPDRTKCRVTGSAPAQLYPIIAN